jgi:hypothetical protein
LKRVKKYLLSQNNLLIEELQYINKL